jgi:hypothetical protein
MVDHREEQDRWAKLTLLGCPVCGVEVLVIDLPVSPFVWCASCPATPSTRAKRDVKSKSK